MTYPATNLNEAVELIIPDSNALHDIINGEATETVTLPEGGSVPTLRKAIADNFYNLTNHNSLTNRDDAGSHPASAIVTDDGRNLEEKFDDDLISKGEWVLGSDVKKGQIWSYQGEEWRSLTGTDVEPSEGDDWRPLFGGSQGGQLTEDQVLGIVNDTLGGTNPLEGLDTSQDATGAAAGIKLFGELDSGSNKWYGGVLAPNGKIYGIPSHTDKILEIDPVTGTTTLFGSLGITYVSKWVGGVLAPNGKIYGIPWNSTKVLEIDPVTQTTTLFGSFGNGSKWSGGVLAPNGKIYGIPNGSTQVLEIDPETQTTTLFGELPSGQDKWQGGVLAPNGKIYSIPWNSTQVLEIDPVARTTTLFGSFGSGSKWSGGVLAPNGKIYGIPNGINQVLEIDTVNKTTTLFGELPTGIVHWNGGVLAPNGKIYGIPYNRSQILEIDPVNKTTTLFGSFSGTTKWFGGVLAPNGKIYGIPSKSTQVLEISKGMNGSNFWALSAYVNKF